MLVVIKSIAPLYVLHVYGVVSWDECIVRSFTDLSDFRSAIRSYADQNATFKMVHKDGKTYVWRKQA